MVTRRARLSDSLSMSDWQRLRNQQLAGADDGFVALPLSDDMSMDEWQRTRNAQLGQGVVFGGEGHDTMAGGSGDDPLVSSRPMAPARPPSGQIGLGGLGFEGTLAASDLAGPATRAAGEAIARMFRRDRPKPQPAPKPHAPKPAPTYTKRDAALDLGAKYLLERIAIGEHDGHPVSYETTYGYGAFVPPGSKKLTEMTFDEVAALQEEMLRRQPIGSDNRSRPVGKYQFMPETLERLRARLGLKRTDVLTPGVQDMMARELLEERGYSDFLAGKIDGPAFQAMLAREWASVAEPATGKSRYAGQRAGTSNEQIQAALVEARKEAQRRINEFGVNPAAKGWR